MKFETPKFETPNFLKEFTISEAQQVSEIFKTNPHVRSVSLIGAVKQTQKMHSLRFVIEVDSDELFHNFAESFSKEKGDAIIAPERRLEALSRVLGDDLLFKIDESFTHDKHAGNFIDAVIVPPGWQSKIDFVQSRLPFDDITTAELIDALKLSES